MNSIFAKQKNDGNNTEGIQQRTILSIDNLKKIIPQGVKNSPDNELIKTSIEWRWRYFDIDGRKMVEISQKKPNEKRRYIDNTGQMIYYDLDEKWEKYLIGSNYYYVDR